MDFYLGYSNHGATVKHLLLETQVVYTKKACYVPPPNPYLHLKFKMHVDGIIEVNSQLIKLCLV